MATIKEIAARAGVSIGTVDRVLHDRGHVAPEKREEITSFYERAEGFRTELADRYPQMKADQTCFFIDHTAKLDLPKKRPSAFYLVNPGDYSICRTLQEHYQNPVPIITNDRPEECRRLMEEGIIAVTVCQQPEQQGSLALTSLVDLATGRREAAGDHYTELSIHIRQNI